MLCLRWTALVRASAHFVPWVKVNMRLRPTLLLWCSGVHCTNADGPTVVHCEQAGPTGLLRAAANSSNAQKALHAQPRLITRLAPLARQMTFQMTPSARPLALC